MTLIFGGAYQGKLDWVKANLCEGEPTVYTCHAETINLALASMVIDKLHLYVLACIRAGHDPVAEVMGQIDGLADKIILCDDITGGVVPIDAEMRAWREAVGRVMGLLSGRADRVVRVFCGMGTVVKPQ